MRSTLSRVVRFTGIGVVVAIIVGIIRSVKPKSKPPATGTASWPPLVEEAEAVRRSGPVQFTDPPADTPAESPAEPTPESGNDTGSDKWVEPADGSCPASHPLKANTQSHIFHVPGGGSYDRTHAERCYAEAADAEADGFRQAKR